MPIPWNKLNWSHSAVLTKCSRRCGSTDVLYSDHSGGPLHFVSLCWCKQINLVFIWKLLATINNLITECWVNNSATKFKAMKTLHDAKSAAITVQLVAGAGKEEERTNLSQSGCRVETVKNQIWKHVKTWKLKKCEYLLLMRRCAHSLSPDGALECVRLRVTYAKTCPNVFEFVFIQKKITYSYDHI